MNPPLSTPKPCLFQWLVKDVQKAPTIKVSPIFEMQVGNSKEMIQIQLSNNHDLIQLNLQLKTPSSTLSAAQLVTTIIADVSLVFKYQTNQTKQFDKVKVKESGGNMWFETTPLSFKTITNNYQDPFSVVVLLHLRANALPLAVVRPPSSQSSELSEPRDDEVSSSSSSISAPLSAAEPIHELVRFVWPLEDVQKLPLIKISPLFNFTIGKTAYQIRLTMDINNDRIQMRMQPLNTDLKKFALLLNTVSLVFQPSDNSKPIKEDNIQLRKVHAELIYLTTLKLSFADMTAKHRSRLEITMQLSFRKTPQKAGATVEIERTAMEMNRKPLPFTWKIVDVDMNPLTKTSPWFRMQIPDKSFLIVQLLLKHNRNAPIQLCLKTAMKRKELAASIDKVLIKIICANKPEQIFTNVVPQLIDNLICFDLGDFRITFAELTNEYKDAFRIFFLFHRSQSDNTQPPVAQQPTVLPPIANPAASLFAPNPQHTALVRQLNALLVDQVDCDVHFDCLGTQIGAHRSILRTRSSFFRELLLQHNDQSLFHFKSVDAETMADTLQFIYTGTAPRIAITAERLLSVANMMELPELHEMAQQQLLPKETDDLSMTSRESIVKLLDMLEEQRLHDHVGTFIRTHLDELLANGHFERELMQRPTVCFEILGLIHNFHKSQVR